MNQDGQFVSESCSTTRPFVCKAEFYYFEPNSYDEIDANLGMPLPCDQVNLILIPGHNAKQNEIGLDIEKTQQKNVSENLIYCQNL